MSAIAFDAYLDDTDMMAAINRIERRMMGMTDNVSTNTKQIDSDFSGLGKSIAAAFTIGAVEQFIQKTIEVRGTFQQLQTGFETMLGSKGKADELMGQVLQLAAKTPFTLQDVAQGAKSLLAFQIPADEVIGTLQRLGDVSSGLGVPIDRLILAYGQVKAKGKLMGDDLRQFTGAGIPMVHELAKQFGVADSQISQMVESGAIGFDKVKQVIQGLTNEGGMFYNLMEKNSHSVSGLASNLEDAFDRMFNKIGESNQGLISGALIGLTDMVDHYEEVGKVILSLVAVYGTYKAAVMAMAAMERVVAASKTATLYLEMARGLGEVTIAHKANAVAIGIEAAAQKALNTVMAINPYVLAATAIVAVAAAVWALHDSTTTAEQAQLEYNATKEEAAKKEEEHKRKIEELINTATNQSLADMDRVKSLSELKKEYPSIFKQYDIENLKLADILKLKKQIAAEDSRKKTDTNTNNAKTQADKVADLQKQYDKSVSVANSSGSYVSVNAQLIKEELDKEKEKLKLYDKQVQTDRANAWISNVKNLNDKQVDAELAARKRLIHSIEKNGGKGLGVLQGSGAAGTWNKDELKAQTDALEAEYKRRNQTTYNYVELEKKYQKDLSDLQAKRNALKSSKTRLSETDYNAQLDDLDKQIKAAKAKLEVYDPKQKKAPKQADPMIEFKKELDAKKAAYEAYTDWVNEFGQDSANRQYALLIKQAGSLEAYYNQKKDALLSKQQNGGKLSPLEQKELNELVKRASEASQTKKAPALFEEELAKAKAEAKDVFDLIAVLQKKKDELASNDHLSAPQKIKYAQQINKDQSEAESKLENDLLEKYKSYSTQRFELEDLYNKKIAKLHEMGQTEAANNAQKERDKTLAELDNSKFTDNNKGILDKVFGNLEGYSTDSIVRMISNVRVEMSKASYELQQSDYFKQLKESLDKLESDTEKSDSNPFRKLSSAWSNYQNAQTHLGAAKDLGLDTSEQTANVNKSFKELGQAAAEFGQQVGSVFDSVVGGLKELGLAGDEENQKMLGEISGMISGASNLAMGIATGNPLQIVQGSIDLIVNGIKVFDGKSRQIERNIKKHQQAVKELEFAYSDLKRAVDDALGTGSYDAQKKSISNLQEQKKQYEELIKLEESKKGKDRDQAKIDEYRKQQQQLGYDIADEQKKLTEELIQTNVKDLAQSLADSLTDAFSQGESAAKAFDKTVNDVMLNVVKNAFKKNVIETALTPLINQMTGAMADYNISPEEMAAIQSVAGQVKGNVLAGMEQYKSMISSLGLTDSSNSLEGAIKGITSEQASLLAGQFNAFRINSAEELVAVKSILNIIASSQSSANPSVSEGLRIGREQLMCLQQIVDNTTFNKHLALLPEIRDSLKSGNYNDPLRSKGL